MGEEKCVGYHIVAKERTILNFRVVSTVLVAELWTLLAQLHSTPTEDLLRVQRGLGGGRYGIDDTMKINVCGCCLDLCCAMNFPCCVITQMARHLGPDVFPCSCLPAPGGFWLWDQSRRQIS